MSIIRVSKNKDHPYILINKASIHDPNLSLRAKGLLVYLFGFPDDWKVKVTHLCKVCKEGRDTIYGVIKELEDHGYIRRYQRKKKDGTFAPIEYILSEEPLTENPEAVRNQQNSHPNFEDKGNEPFSPLTENPEAASLYILNNNTKTPNPLKRGSSSSKKSKIELEEEFEEVWNEWPLKRSKEASKRAYVKARGLTTRDTIKNAVRAYKREIEALCEKRKNDKKVFVPSYAHFSTWLNGSRWNDVYESSKTTVNEAEIKKSVQKDIESKKEVVIEGLPKGTWQNICKNIATNLGINTYHSWFAKITPTHFKAGCLYLQAPTKFMKDHIESHFGNELLKAIKSVLPYTERFKFE